MNDWLLDAFPGDVELQLPDIVVRLVAALVLGAAVGAIYRVTRPRPVAGRADLTQTLLLLAVVIAMITLAIGSNVARAFSLVGALAIVRFRSVVDDPRDTAFVILAVAVGLAVGAGFLTVPLVGLPIAGVVAMGFAARGRRRGAGPVPCTVVVRLEPDRDPAAVQGAINAALADARLERAGTAKKGTVVELVYRAHLVDPAAGAALVRRLRGEPGVVAVDLVCRPKP